MIHGYRLARLASAAIPLLLLPAAASAQSSIFTPGDAIWGIQVDRDTINVGVVGFNVGQNNWPTNEGPEHAIDGVGQKYLNFGKTNTGFITTPSAGPTIAHSITMWTANDAEPRDPSGYEVWGTNVSIGGGGPFSLVDFVLISADSITLPSTRNAGGAAPLEPQNALTVNFTNTDAYTTYLIVFPDVKDNPLANSMQVAEVQLDGEIVPAPATAMLLGLALAATRRRR